MEFTVRRDDLCGVEIQALLHEHMTSMLSNSPPESVHALPLEALCKPEITFWSIWHANTLCGCGALKELDPLHGEVKSMRTRAQFLRTGVAQAALNQIIVEATARGYQRISLETGSSQAFEPAHALYYRNGFVACGPFGDYKEDTFSLFMCKQLR